MFCCANCVATWFGRIVRLLTSSAALKRCVCLSYNLYWLLATKINARWSTGYNSGLKVAHNGPNVLDYNDKRAFCTSVFSVAGPASKAPNSAFRNSIRSRYGCGFGR